MRTNELKAHRELRSAARFCVGMSELRGTTVYVGRGESQDYDFVAAWVEGDTSNFARVQLKEVVPPDLNPESSLNALLESLVGKYTDSQQLVLAVHLNRPMHFDPSAVRVPALGLASIWVFGSISPDDSEWALWGNFVSPPVIGVRFRLPS